jgi:amino acid adenylation domain-containing protein
MKEFSTVEFLSYLRGLHVQLSVDEDGGLRYSAPTGVMTYALKNELAARKMEILKFLNEACLATHPLPPPMKRIPRDGKLPLSFAQQRLWFLDQLEPDSPLYNIPQAFRLRGALKVEALRGTFEVLVTRHESLRTTFSIVDETPVQCIAEKGSFSMPVIDLTGLPEAGREVEAQRLAGEEFRRPFNLSQGPLLRVTLLRLGEKEHILLLVIHHIISDGWSMGVLVKEMAALYEAFCVGNPSPLVELPIQYADFAHWQREWFQGEVLGAQVQYWKKQLGGTLPILELPTDRPRPAVQIYRGKRRSLAFSKDLSEGLKALSQREGVTLFMMLLAAFQTLLHRYTGQEDIIVGSPIANRNRLEIEGLIGFFVNTLVLRSDLSGNPPFRELLSRVREVALGAYGHQDLPFEKLVEELQVPRDLSYNPLFQVMLVLQNAPMQALQLSGLTLSPLEVETGTAKFDLTLELVEGSEGFAGGIEYNTDLFDTVSIDRMVGHFQTLLQGIVANPEQRIAELPLLSEGERHQLLVEWNATEVEYPRDKCLHELFEEQVERTPDGVALVFEGKQLTYRELNGRANQLAHYLRKMGVGPEVLVGIFMERSFEMVIAMYGILKAGGAYVPLDPEYPPERVAFMARDTQVPVLLTQRHLMANLPEHKAKVICLDSDWPGIVKENSQNLASGATAENLAYVIYTSGSTGMPKGAMNTHRGICNRLLWMQDEYQLTDKDRVLQKTPFSFDVSVWEFFWPLLVGACMVVARPGGHKDSHYLVKTIQEQEITTLHFVPSMLQVFLEEKEVEKCFTLKRVICSGEALPYELQEHFFARLPAELHNLYGPTEAAVDVTYWACKRGSDQRIVPIGYPVANTQMYILDSHLQPVPIGVPGELYIGGIQVGRGYLNRPELTAEKFIPDPFRAVPRARLYRTGDLARYLPGGEIEYLGRTDHQVKIRGFRIELGEIEAVLGEHESIGQVVVMAREDIPGEKRLVAYIVPDGNQPPSASVLRQYLQEKLPEYMVPGAFITLEKFPLSPNGKIDRKTLPAPASIRPVELDYVAPRTEMERTIAAIWQEVLHLEKVGTHDNFFELGGHSLLATQVVSRIKKTLGIDLPLQLFFKNPIIAGLSGIIEKLEKEGAIFQIPGIRPISRESRRMKVRA